MPNLPCRGQPLLYVPCKCAIGAQLLEQRTVSKSKPYKTSKRIRCLAKPRQMRRKYYKPPVKPYTRSTQIVRAYREPFASTRTHQLALPRVRRLIAARNEYSKFVDLCKRENYRKLIKKSLFSVYSRIANVQLPAVRKTKAMTADQWEHHLEWLQKNANAREVRTGKEQPRKKVPLEDLLTRLWELSEPRYVAKKYKGPEKVRYVKAKALKATPSERLQVLCIPQPRHKREKGPIVEDTKIPETVLKATASERVVSLSAPKKYTGVYNEFRDNPFTVEPNALKAKASDRILELALPKKVKK